MNFAKCYFVPNKDSISEGYELGQELIIANIETEKIKSVIKDFIANVQFPIFFFIETPCTLQEERLVADENKSHKDVYYLDYCPKEFAEEILTNDLDILLNCGMCEFGFGSCNRDEIYICRYNIVRFYSENIQKYQTLLTNNHIDQKGDLITAWDVIDQDNPAETSLIKIDGKDYRDLMPKYFKNGMYLYPKLID